MTDQAIALCRVSTPEQRQNNSLNRQEESVRNAAALLRVDIVRWWTGDASSKVGKNYKRKDLTEAFEFARSHNRIKYLIVDEVDRFMRSTAEMFYWMTKFEQEAKTIVYFASNPDHNTADAKARLLLSLEGFKAEGSNEERQHKSVVGHEKAIREGRYTFVPKPGYQKGTQAGVHVREGATFTYLQSAFKSVASGLQTPQEALRTLNSSKFSQSHAVWRMDRFRKFAIDPYYAGILTINKQVKATNQSGLHEAMISLEEHEELLRVFTGSVKHRGLKQQYNPDFPMNKILTCTDCGPNTKFTGSKKNNGYSRLKTSYYYKYHCRGCGKSYHRDTVHAEITKRLDEVIYTGEQEQGVVDALIAVWETKEKDSLTRIKALKKRITSLEDTKSKMVREMVVAEPEYKDDIKQEIDLIKQQITGAQIEIGEYTHMDNDLADFIQFSLSYTDKLSKDWWQLSHDDRVRCQQLLFPGGISFGSDKKVGTTGLSPLYSLQPNKKALDFASKALVVELVGTAPTSAGLSWLIVYRHSSSLGLKLRVSKRTNIP